MSTKPNKPKFDFTDTSLFGNEAAEDENASIFESYALDDAEFVTRFRDPKRSIAIARAYKGEGKSALLRITRNWAKTQKEAPLIVNINATEITPTIESNNFEDWSRAWKEAILDRIGYEIAARYDRSWDTDIAEIAQQASRAGYKRKSIISLILGKLDITFGVPGAVTATATLTPNSPSSQTPLAPTVDRWLSNGADVWVFIDDIDENFDNTDRHKTKVASLLSALRDITKRQEQSIKVRATIRPNIWAVLEFESLSKVEQYLVDIKWDEKSLQRLLAKRIQAYLERSDQWYAAEKIARHSGHPFERALIALAFEDPMEWGSSTRPPHVILTTLSKHRPRWMIKLAHHASSSAHSNQSQKISLSHIQNNMEGFGRSRISDTVAEFRPSCNQISDILNAFDRAPHIFNTNELLTYIKNRISNHISVTISGTIGPANNRDIARFLFEIGFIFGREDLPDQTYQHVSFSEEPYIFSRTALDKGLKWEIHPVYRQALRVNSNGY